ncbi:MAG: hypothetical protein C6H99_06295 [Epsilonproteobacteria bacterium]|nr:hypothetical protein [Campylobacterota bacterium]NPA63774.1 hypothetical protein [Campylobacterota bacterium]
MRIFLIGAFLSILSLARVIDAVAIVVNGQPITTYEIEKSARELGIPPSKAIDLLIQKKIEQSEIKRLGIDVDDFELERAIEEFARKKGMDIFDLRQTLQRQGIGWQEYKKRFKEQLLRQKLYDKIAQIQMGHITEDRLKEYYDTHPEQFEVAKSVSVVKYISPSKEILEQIRSNPLYEPTDPLLLQKGEEVVDLEKVNPQFAAMLSQTPEGSFTQILPLGDRYLLLYIQSKEGKEIIPFEEAKEYILNKLAKENRAKVIKDYFDKLRAGADIQILKEHYD